jgi:type IV pilus assembly protein PilZ
MLDHRLTPRVPVHLEVRYRDGAELASSYVQSLSTGGVFIRTSRPLPIGTELLMEIVLEDQPDRAVRLRGKVVWDRHVGRDDGMGVRFLEPLPEDLRKLLTAKVA